MLLTGVDTRNVVLKDPRIGGDQGQSLELGLRDEDVIEWIMMMRWQQACLKGVASADWQRNRSFACQSIDEVCRRDGQLDFPQAMLHGDLEGGHR